VAKFHFSTPYILEGRDVPLVGAPPPAPAQTAMEKNEHDRNAAFQLCAQRPDSVHQDPRNSDFCRNRTLNRRMNRDLKHDRSSAPNPRQPRIASVGSLPIAADNLGWFPEKPNLSGVICTCLKPSAQKSSFPLWMLGLGASFQRSSPPVLLFCISRSAFKSSSSSFSSSIRFMVLTCVENSWTLLMKHGSLINTRLLLGARQQTVSFNRFYGFSRQPQRSRTFLPQTKST